MTTRDEGLLQDSIRDALDADPEIDAFEVAVEVRGGVVRLHGTVGSYAEKLEALAMARRYAEGREVVSDLAVRPSGETWRMTDQEIADGVRQRLGVVLVRSGDVDVAVDNRVVTLTGTLPTVDERALVRHVVETAPGVDFVDVDIEVGTR